MTDRDLTFIFDASSYRIELVLYEEDDGISYAVEFGGERRDLNVKLVNVWVLDSIAMLDDNLCREDEQELQLAILQTLESLLRQCAADGY